jgi:hypothetical protein
MKRDNNTPPISQRVIDVAVGAKLDISNLKIEQGRYSGYSANYGGTVFNAGLLILNDVVISYSYADNGGGGIANIGTVYGYYVAFLNNYGGGGGAIQNDRGGKVRLSCSKFQTNHATYGGAILNGSVNNAAGQVIIDKSVFFNNTAEILATYDIFNFSNNPPSGVQVQNSYWSNSSPSSRTARLLKIYLTLLATQAVPLRGERDKSAAVFFAPLPTERGS